MAFELEGLFALEEIAKVLGEARPGFSVVTACHVARRDVVEEVGAVLKLISTCLLPLFLDAFKNLEEMI